MTVTFDTPESPANAIELRALTKVYRGRKRSAPKTALDALDLDIERGSFFGLLGPNGAGKSTLINIFAGVVIKTSGQARTWGSDIDHSPRQARASIGVVPQELMIDPFFTPREALDLQAGYYGVPKRERRTDEILAAVGLTEMADAYARALSGGMRRRPEDPDDWSYLRELQAGGTTVLLTTHYLEEAEQLCDRIAIIHQGQVVACDTTSALVRRLDQKTLTIALAEDIDQLPGALTNFDVELQPFRQLLIRYRPSHTPIGAYLAAVQSAGLTILDLTTEESDLEDIFIELTRSPDGKAA